MAAFLHVAQDYAPPCLLAARWPQICVIGYTTKAEPSENDAYVMGNLGTIFVYMVWEACILDK